MPQIEELTQNVAYVLEELVNLTNNILVYDREPPVSSLHLLSREPTQKSFQPVGESALSFSNPIPVAPPATLQDMARGGSQASSHRSDAGKGEARGRLSVDGTVDKTKVVELENQYTQIKQQLEDNGKQHQEQLQRNTVVMMEMQDTINELQRELSALGKSAKQTKSRLSSARGSAVHVKSPSPETSVMFTRLDSERNAKIMKKAVMDDKLNAEKYKEAVAKMDEYVSLPAQRLAHLVRKYMHHTRMRAIEEKVKNSSSVNEEVFEVLDKMEDLQNRRARQWAERMDEMGIERLKLANLLMDTLDTIEQESGIFLIKPMYSYKGREVKPGGHAGKLSRPVRAQHRIGTGNARHTTPTNDGASSFVPAPTPASNYRLVRHERHFLQQQQQQQVPATMAEMRPVETRASKDDGQVKVMGNGMTFAAGSPRTTWNMQSSQPWFVKDDPANQFNTPRILELDVNRMLIGQNNISSKVPFPPSEDRLLNANNNTLRSYVTVNRPTAPLVSGERPSSGGSTKSTGRKARVSQIDKEIPEALPIPHPLPPISSIQGDEGYEEEEEEEERNREIRAPSVAFSDQDDNEEEEEEDGENENTEPPHRPPGSSLYYSVVTKNEDEEDDDDNDNKEDTTLTQD
ncbi:hypothetical protein RRG08_043921 [Elysia crispata]|uniref:Uncharacterized protein n=1 Tax=Elysia crispata TaxID=231223 RepID=A0AAE0YBY8_9GAST|nr:hypothetical protein RRG08_043921 [Elysia crispata]